MAQLPAAGMPWFMTVFGRDTLITSYQTLLLGQELARGALEVLAELQATEDDPSIDAEPGKIVHEVRHGKAAKAWFRAVLRDGRRDAALPRAALGGLALDRRRRARPAACASRRCGRSAGSTPFDGFISYKRRTARGLENQSWKDSGDSQRFADGRIAAAADRAGRGAGLRLRREAARTAELAREVWGDAGLAERLERDAADLQRRFDEAYWTRRALRARARPATARGSTRCARTSATCSGAGSSPTSASTRSSRR